MADAAAGAAVATTVDTIGAHTTGTISGAAAGPPAAGAKTGAATGTSAGAKAGAATGASTSAASSAAVGAARTTAESAAGAASSASANSALKFPMGTVVWARPKGWPWWPAMVVPYNLVLFLPEKGVAPFADDRKVSVEFFYDGRISVLSPSDVVLYHEGMHRLRVKGRYAGHIRAAAKAAEIWIDRHCTPADDMDDQEAELELVEEVERLKKEIATESALLKREKQELHELRKERYGMGV